MTQTNLRDCWTDLLSEQPQAGRDLRLRLVHGGLDVRVFAAVGANDSLPGLLVELPNELKPHVFKPLVTRAFQMSAPALIGLPSGRWGLAVQLCDRTFVDLFEILGMDVLKAASNAPSGAESLEAVLRCVGRWRRFLERRAEPLSEEEVRGLIGELVVLCRCSRRFGASAALSAWTGPERGLRDFELPDASIEVKTFQGNDAATVRIAPPDQLDTVAERPVYLGAVRVTPAEMQGATLGEFVGRALAVVCNDPVALGLFEDRLAAAGYLASHAPLYVKRFVAGPVHMYVVTPAFPRIRSAELPNGVLDVRFALSLNALSPFRTDSTSLIGDRVPEIEVVQ